MDNVEHCLDLASYIQSVIIPAIDDAAGIPLLMLSCMDNRYPRLILETMEDMGLRGKYDQLILAGVGLGIMHAQEWRSTFLAQLQFAIEHHGVQQVLLLEHRDCGAYREFLGVTPADPARERAAHLDMAKQAIDVIVDAFPQLRGNVRALLLPIAEVDELIPAEISEGAIAS